MPRVTVNAEQLTLPDHCTLAELLARLGKDPARLAVERNELVVPRADHARTTLADGDRVEIVTLVGGGQADDAALKVGPFTFQSRLFTGTGKFANHELMRDCMAASGCEVTTVAVRRERVVDGEVGVERLGEAGRRGAHRGQVRRPGIFHPGHRAVIHPGHSIRRSLGLAAQRGREDGLLGGRENRHLRRGGSRGGESAAVTPDGAAALRREPVRGPQRDRAAVWSSEALPPCGDAVREAGRNDLAMVYVASIMTLLR